MTIRESAPPSAGKRLRELDALRGLAAVAVALHHNLLASDLLTGRLHDILFASFQMLAKGRQAVMFFFVLSGFVLTRSLSSWEGRATPAKWFAWGVQRSVRLGLPVFVSLMISAALYASFHASSWDGEGVWLAQYLWQRPPTPASVLQQAMLVRSAYSYEGNNVLWSLAHEWRLSLLLPVVVAIPAFRQRNAPLLLLLLGLACAGLAAGRFGSEMNLNPGPLGHARSTMYFVLPFAVGAALERAGVWRLEANRLLLIVGFAAAAALGRMDSDLADYTASAILIWLAIQPSFFRELLLHPVLQWLGRISFSLYLTHELVIAPLHHQLHALIGPWQILALSILLAFVAAQLFYTLVEKRAHRFANLLGSSLRRIEPTSASGPTLTLAARKR